MPRERARRLAEEARLVTMRRKYVGLKDDFWQAVASGGAAEAERLSGATRVPVLKLKAGS